MSMAFLRLLPCVFLAACATPRVDLGEVITADHLASDYRARDVLDARPRDDLLFMISFSGGGTRAAAMAVGVLEQLAQDHIESDSGSKALLNEVDVISAVSGGAVTAAYYLLQGEHAFSDLPEQFLDRDVTAELRRKILWSPTNWLRMSSREFSRGDLYAEHLDRKLFRGARFSDLATGIGRPLLIISATDIGQGARFDFTQEAFDAVCLRLGPYSLARAVAASSSVPALLTPITLRNRADLCTNKKSNKKFAYLHLVDGALSDNLGGRALLEAIHDPEDRLGLQRFPLSGSAPKIVYISVNAGDQRSLHVGGRRQPPDALDMLRLMGTVPVDHYTAATQVLLHAALQEHAQRKQAKLHVINVELGELRENSSLERLVELPTSFDLPPGDSMALRCAARMLLTRSPAYRELLRELGAAAPATVSRCRES